MALSVSAAGVTMWQPRRRRRQYQYQRNVKTMAAISGGEEINMAALKRHRQHIGNNGGNGS